MGMLPIACDVRPDKDDQPADVDPDNEQYRRGQARVDRRVLGGARNQVCKQMADTVPGQTGEDTSDQGRYQTDSTVYPSSPILSRGRGVNHVR